MSMGNLTRVAGVSDIASGGVHIVNVGRKTIAVFSIDGTLYAIDNTCLHRGGPLGEGKLEGITVTCPWHGWKYNISTGENLTKPDKKIATYPVTVKDGSIFVEIS
jgi:nitrite reductase (NADH) small subunit